LFLLLAVATQGTVFSQNTMDPNMTLQSLFSDTSNTIGQLNSFKLHVDANVNVTVDPAIAGDMKIAADGIIAGLNTQMQQLRDMVNNDLSKQVSQLNSGTAEVARSINSAVQRAGLVLQYQQQSFVASSQVLLSGLQTVALDLKQATWHKKDEPRLYYFSFSGAPPSSVPKQGGRVEIFGYDLWSEKTPQTPKVELVSDTGTDLKSFKPEHGSSPNSISLDFPSDTVAANVGKCLRFHVTTSRAKLLRSPDEFELYLPVCIAQAFDTQFTLTGNIAYDCAGTTTTELPVAKHQFFRWDNKACNTKMTVNQVNHWDAELAPGCKIASYRTLNHEEQLDGSNVNLSITGRTDITASGTVTSPTCITVKIPPFGPTVESLKKIAVWATDVIPSEECPSSQNVQKSVDSSPTEATVPTTQICVQIPSTCPASAPDRKNDLTAFWFSVTPIINGQAKPAIYTSTRITSGNTGATSPLTVKGGLGFEGDLNTTPVGGTFEVCGTITSTSP